MPYLWQEMPNCNSLTLVALFFFFIRLSLDPEGRLKWRGRDHFGKYFIKESLWKWRDTKNSNLRIRLQFYMRNPFKNENIQNWEITFNFIWEIPLKLNWTKKKCYQKIELTFNFRKEIHVKITRNKKKSTLKFGSKNTL